jgi:tetratricopeptide (TPR) repeat protein
MSWGIDSPHFPSHPVHLFLKRAVRFTRSLPSFLLALALFLGASVHSRAAQSSEPSKAALAAGTPYLRALQAAGIAYMNRDFATALDKLDVADQIAPNIPDTWSMRGAIYAEQHAYEKAGDAFEKAGELNPGDFWAPYNMAELLLLEKKYDEAAQAFGKLEVYAGHEELVQFKIIYADLLAGKPEAAKPVLDAMKFPCDTPAYYYAQSAWGAVKKDRKEALYWSATGLKVFGLARCLAFYDALAQVGWLPMRNADGSIPEAAADLSVLPTATPAVGLPGVDGDLLKQP